MNKHQFHRLLILSRDFELYKQILEQERLPGLSILANDDPQSVIRFGQDCDLVFGEPSLVCQVVNVLPKLVWIQSSWAGVEPLLVDSLRHDYILTNARNVYGEMMSEFVFGYLLMNERRILSRWQSQMRQEWDERPSGSLKGKLIGLVGVGTIGAHLAKTAHHFNMRVYGYTLQSENCPDIDRYFHTESIHAFVSELDYMVCSLPGTPNTRNLINASILFALPAKAWIVNIGRGNTLDENALVEVLNRGSLAGAVLDVFNEEPLPPNHPLWHTPNTYITSHTAAKNYPPDIASIFVENYKLLLDGKPLHYQVDFNQYY